MPLITINQVQKFYGDNHVLKGVDLDINMGEVISIMAEAARGKAPYCAALTGWRGTRKAVLSSVA